MVQKLIDGGFFDKASWKLKLLIIYGPQILMLLLFVTYLIVSAHIYMILDEKVADEGFWHTFFFAYTVALTIGYKNVVDKSQRSQDHVGFFTIISAFFAIALALSVLGNAARSLGNILAGKTVVLSGRNESKPRRMCQVTWDVLGIMYFGTILVGLAAIHIHEYKTFVDSSHFFIISFTSIGFGDQNPTIGCTVSTLSSIAYISWGYILTTLVIAKLEDALENFTETVVEKIFFLCLPDIQIIDNYLNISNNNVKVKKFIKMVATEFEISPYEVKSLIIELNELIGKHPEKPISSNQETIQIYKEVKPDFCLTYHGKYI
uniref:Ion_trans_2 domain-containing protein n=1 Tax=Rhabditophanes sp. KR3021 TaxID=114890 RepID=A0AC35TIB1_9BILA